MQKKLKLNPGSQIPVYKQVVNQIKQLIQDGTYTENYLLPSMNELAATLQISKETVKKAYSILRNKGYINAHQGKGFYVAVPNTAKKLNILLLFDRLSSYKQVLFDSFSEEIGDVAEVTIRLHNQNVDLLEYYIDENLDLFDYYVITPHFSLDSATQKRVTKILSRIPNRKLIMVDRWMQELPGNYGVVYQDFENDAYEGLQQGLYKIQNYKKLNVVVLPSSLYHYSIRNAVERFCADNQIAVEFHAQITPKIIRAKEVYLMLSSQYDWGLIELIRQARELNYKIGRDIGIISYNESPINEIILNGLTTISTDFHQMGVLVARMILDKTPAKVKCDFHMIHRDSF